MVFTCRADTFCRLRIRIDSVCRLLTRRFGNHFHGEDVAFNYRSSEVITFIQEIFFTHLFERAIAPALVSVEVEHLLLGNRPQALDGGCFVGGFYRCLPTGNTYSYQYADNGYNDH